MSTLRCSLALRLGDIDVLKLDSSQRHQKIPIHHYTSVVAPMRLTSGGALFRSLAPEQHSSEKISRRWREDGDSVSGLISRGIDPHLSHRQRCLEARRQPASLVSDMKQKSYSLQYRFYSIKMLKSDSLFHPVGFVRGVLFK